jgi:ABC-type sulfate transport system permease component
VLISAILVLAVEIVPFAIIAVYYKKSLLKSTLKSPDLAAWVIVITIVFTPLAATFNVIDLDTVKSFFDDVIVMVPLPLPPYVAVILPVHDVQDFVYEAMGLF